MKPRCLSGILSELLANAWRPSGDPIPTLLLDDPNQRLSDSMHRFNGYWRQYCTVISRMEYKTDEVYFNTAENALAGILQTCFTTGTGSKLFQVLFADLLVSELTTKTQSELFDYLRNYNGRS